MPFAIHLILDAIDDEPHRPFFLILAGEENDGVLADGNPRPRRIFAPTEPLEIALQPRARAEDRICIAGIIRCVLAPNHIDLNQFLALVAENIRNGSGSRARVERVDANGSGASFPP